MFLIARHKERCYFCGDSHQVCDCPHLHNSDKDYEALGKSPIEDESLLEDYYINQERKYWFPKRSIRERVSNFIKKLINKL